MNQPAIAYIIQGELFCECGKLSLRDSGTLKMKEYYCSRCGVDKWSRFINLGDKIGGGKLG